MKIYIMTDMEGISGIRRQEECERASPLYQRALPFFAGDVNAAIAGAFDGGASEVVVCDSHGGGNNLPIALMDDRAIYVENGGIRELMGRLDETCDGFFAVGYHAMAGTLNAFLDHTQSGASVFQYTINGVAYGEIGQQCILAGAHGVPQLLITGDAAAVAEALALTPGIEAVAVKTAYANERVECLHPNVAQKQIRAAAKRAVKLAGKRKPFKLRPPFDIRLTFYRTRHADEVWRQRPWLERLDGRTVRLVTDDVAKLLAVF
ncbi:MAG: M55 family metallopeptidase [Planctomycetota bacterium]